MHTKKDALGDRMKMYENVPNINLMKKTPVICRIDGKAFHTFTRGFKRPFDEVLMKTMQETTKFLCEKIQGCVLGYTQSDEITLVLCDYQTYETNAFFDYRVQKLCSIIASMATLEFNRNFSENMINHTINGLPNMGGTAHKFIDMTYSESYMLYYNAAKQGAMFDCRCYNVPVHEVENVLIWRQQDATRNSIQMVAQSQFSHKQLQNKNCNELQDMLHEEKGINWNNYSTPCKRGTCVIKDDDGKWFIDLNIPIFTQDREYINKRITFED